MDLRSSNSSANLSANSNLKDHYENLLFKSNDDEFPYDYLNISRANNSLSNMNNNNLINKRKLNQNNVGFPTTINASILNNSDHSLRGSTNSTSNIWTSNNTVNRSNSTNQSNNFDNSNFLRTDYTTQANSFMNTYYHTNNASVQNQTSYLPNFSQSTHGNIGFNDYNNMNNNAVYNNDNTQNWIHFNNQYTSAKQNGNSRPKSNQYLNPNSVDNFINIGNNLNENDNSTSLSLNLADEGIILLENKIISSNELHKLSQSYGQKYFSSELVYEFVGKLTNLIEYDATSQNKLLKDFLNFLLNCNNDCDKLINKTDVTLTDYGLENKKRTEYLKSNGIENLVLVSGKNGKLDILSGPINSNLLLKKGDIVIIDGDRGKDLVQVVMPNLKFKLALIINFLKKKIHFDSLITSKDQHFPNSKFIESLMNFESGSSNKINSDVYDISELTHFVIPSKQIIRFAKPTEIAVAIPEKFRDESKALFLAQNKLESLNKNLIISNEKNVKNLKSDTNCEPLNIKLLNAEFQFDRRKLTFYYVCEERNDFRNLVKDLFKFYKTRIWLCAIPNNLNIEKNFSLDLKSRNTLPEINPLKEDIYAEKSMLDNDFIPKNINSNAFQIYIFKNMVQELFQATE